MTQNISNAVAAASQLNEFIGSALTAIVLALFGFVFVASFASM
jgi:hypothetical protein